MGARWHSYVPETETEAQSGHVVWWTSCSGRIQARSGSIWAKGPAVSPNRKGDLRGKDRTELAPEMWLWVLT